MADKDLKFIVTYTGDTVINEDGEVVVKKGQRKVVSDPSEYENSADFQIEVVGSGEGQQEAPGIAETAIRHGAQGLTYGLADEIEGAGRATVDWALDPIRAMAAGKRQPEKSWTQRYSENVQRARERNKAAAAANPVTAFAADIGASMVAPGSRFLRGNPIGQATVQGAAHGAGRSEGSVADRAGGAVVGGSLGTAGAAVSEVAAPAMRWGQQKAKALFNRLVPESADDALIRVRAQKEVGLSPEQKTAQEIEDLATSQKSLSGEITAAEDTMKQHGVYVEKALRDDITSNVTDDLSSLAMSNDTVLDVAHTGLKGSYVDKAFRRFFGGMKVGDQIKTAQKAFKDSNDLVDATEKYVDGVIDDASKGLVERATGNAAKDLKRSIEGYRKLLGAATTEGASPEAMQESFIAMDRLKRKLGKIQGRIKERTAKKDVQAIYEDYRTFLEDPKIWGKEVAKAQKEINEAWTDWLTYNDAIENAYMRSGRRSTTRTSDEWGMLSEGDPAKIQAILGKPLEVTSKKEIKNLEDWLAHSEKLTEVLTKYYKQTPELLQEVASIKDARRRVLKQIRNAQTDATRMGSGGVGKKAQDVALENVEVSRQRGIPETENVRALKDLRSKRAGLEYNIGTQAEKERALRERSVDPALMRERLDADRAYNEALSTKFRDIKDLERSPAELAVVKGARGVGKAGVRAGTAALERKAGPIGVMSGNYSEDLWDRAKAMWGDRPTETTDDEDIEAQMSAIDKEYGLDSKTLNKQQKEAMYLKRSVEDRKSKGGKTTDN